MSKGKLTCGGDLPCQFWRPIPGTTLGACELKVTYNDPPFDYSGCLYHSQRETTPADPIDLQSQVRGPMTYQQWAQKLGKP